MIESTYPITTLRDVIKEWYGGANILSTEYSDSGKPVILKTSVGTFGTTELSEKFVPSKVAETKYAKKSLRNGDLLVCMRDLSSKANILGLISVTNGRHEGALVSQGVNITRIDDSKIKSKYLAYYSNSPYYRDIVKTNKRGSTQVHLGNDDILDIHIPLPSIEMQTRIVSKIEKLFSEIDSGTEELQKAKQKLELYKQSVLNSAIQGKLVPQDTKDEPASNLLERIRAEKEKLIKGKKLKNEKQLPPIDPNSITFELPRGWVLARGLDVFQFVTSGSRGWGNYRGDEGALFLGMGNLDHGNLNIDFKKVERVQLPKGVEGARTLLKLGDILISITADVGMVGVVQEQIEEAYINQHVALARPYPNLSSIYLGYYLNSSFGLKGLKSLQRGATKVGLGLDDIRETIFPLPPRDEQQRIVAKLREVLAEVEATNYELLAKTKSASLMKQSILKSAFEGKLI